MAMEAMLAGRDDRGLELQDGFITQASGVGQIARGASDSGDQPFVRIQTQVDLMG